MRHRSPRFIRLNCAVRARPARRAGRPLRLSWSPGRTSRAAHRRAAPVPDHRVRALPRQAGGGSRRALAQPLGRRHRRLRRGTSPRPTLARSRAGVHPPPQHQRVFAGRTDKLRSVNSTPAVQQVNAVLGEKWSGSCQGASTPTRVRWGLADAGPPRVRQRLNALTQALSVRVGWDRSSSSPS